MLSLLKMRPRRGTESTKPLALASLPTNPRPSEASEAALPPAPSPPSSTHPPSREPRPPKTFLHRFLGHMTAFCRNFTLPLPLAVVVLLVFVHISANQGFWRDLNKGKGGAGSMSWAPFWIGIIYFLVYIPWWYVVWANYWRSQRKNRPFLSRRVHLGGEIAAILVTAITLALTALVSRTGETLVVGFSYVVTMAAFFGIQMDADQTKRWIEATSVEEKKQQGAMIPFGGGQNLCPGRCFAQAENLGFVAIVVGFEVEGIQVPEATDAYLGAAMRRPVGNEGPATKLTRRTGWEDVRWEFKR